MPDGAGFHGHCVHLSQKLNTRPWLVFLGMITVRWMVSFKPLVHDARALLPGKKSALLSNIGVAVFDEVTQLMMMHTHQNLLPGQKGISTFHRPFQKSCNLERVRVQDCGYVEDRLAFVSSAVLCTRLPENHQVTRINLPHRSSTLA